MFKKIVLGAIAALSMAIGVAGVSLSEATPVSAAPGNGAINFSDKACFDAGGGDTYCFVQQGTFNETVAGKSGNYNAVSNGKGSYQLLDAQGAVAFEGEYKSHYKLGADVNGVRVYRSSYSDSWSSGGVTCSFSYDIHLTVIGGVVKVQYDRFEGACTP